jgi:phosphate transport system permease protein
MDSSNSKNKTGLSPGGAKKWRRLKDKLIHRFFQFNGLLSILILLGIFILLLAEGFPAVKELGLSPFAAMTWNPTSYVKESYGLGAMIISTLMVTLGAMILAVPIGLACAAYLAEAAPVWVREILKPIIEILAGIPSVVLGFLGIVVIGPFIARLFHLPNGLNAVNGSILLAVMSLPTIISISEDAISAVPQTYKDASLAVGANRWQTLIKVVVPSALSGIIASIMLGMGRAIGETMTVLMATGNALQTPTGFFDSVRTMTATIAIELGEVPFGSAHYHGLFVVGFILFLMTFLVNWVADLVLAKYQEVDR